MQLLRPHVALIVAALVATLVLGTLVGYAERPRATLQNSSLDASGPGFAHVQTSTPTQTPTFTEPAAAPAAVSGANTTPAAAPSADLTVATAVPATVTPPATTTSPARPDLSGTWRGEYVDASGKQLLRVVSLSISRVHEDGGIEGTLHYETAAGDGECKLHPRGSTYLAGERRLQLSPENCSPHYPRELGVPLDFDGVNPRADTLRDGRIEAPSGAVISVKLQRVSGIWRGMP